MASNHASEDYLCPDVVARPKIRICDGKACRKLSGRAGKLQESVNGHCRVGTIKCQDICKGPVVVVQRAGERYWFSGMQGKRNRMALVAFLDTGKLSKRLRRRLKKRRE
jgi:hypothetical protein